jgi:hypothetical protein
LEEAIALDVLSSEAELAAFLFCVEGRLDGIVKGGRIGDGGVDDLRLGASANSGGGSLAKECGEVIEGVTAA